MRVVVSVGGSVLVPSADAEPVRECVDAEPVREYADAVRRIHDAAEVGVVVGGGGVAREYIEAARSLGTDEMRLDEIGIRVTRLNARLLLSALGEAAIPSPAENYEAAGAALRRGEVAVMGGVAPGQTTDAVAAALAEYVGADRLVYATSVDGVYSADPDADDGATRYDRLTARELLDVVSDVELSAGSSAPVDILAAKLIERSGVPAVVLDGTDPDAVVEAALRGEHDGTDVVQADGAD